jgi:N-methylhydantoinase A
MFAEISSKSAVLQILEDLSNEARNRLIEQGASEDKIDVEWSIDMRYVGQSHELPVQIRQNETDAIADSLIRFESLHQESFGYMMKGRQIEWVTARVSATTHSRNYRRHQHHTKNKAVSKAIREIVLNNGERTTAEVYRRENLDIGKSIHGPAIVEQLDTTLYIGPGWIAEQRTDGTLWMRRTRE